MIKLCLILQPINKIAADKTKFPVGIDAVRDCDSHVKASPQSHSLETTNIVPTTFFWMSHFLRQMVQSWRSWSKQSSKTMNFLLRWLSGASWLSRVLFSSVSGSVHSEASEVVVANDSKLSSRSTRALSFDKWYCSIWVPVYFIQSWISVCIETCLRF